MRQLYKPNRLEFYRISRLPFYRVSGVVVHYEGNKRYELDYENGLVDCWEVERL